MKIGPLSFFERKEIGAGIMEDPTPLLIRYQLVKIGEAAGIYVHHFLRSDYDRALHDHPWGFLSLILRGGYTEVHDQTPDGKQVDVYHEPGTIIFRRPKWRHRVMLAKGKTAWTFILVGPRVRKWGFHLDTGWCWWRHHNPHKNICETEPYYNGGAD